MPVGGCGTFGNPAHRRTIRLPARVRRPGGFIAAHVELYCRGATWGVGRGGVNGYVFFLPSFHLLVSLMGRDHLCASLGAELRLQEASITCSRKTTQKPNPFRRYRPRLETLEIRETPTATAFGFGSSGPDVGNAVATDPGGNVYVIGSFTGSAGDFDPGPGSLSLSSFGQAMFVAKYTATGSMLWAEQIGGPGANVQGLGIVTEASGTVFITGSFSGTADFDPGQRQQCPLHRHFSRYGRFRPRRRHDQLHQPGRHQQLRGQARLERQPRLGSPVR